MERGAYNKLVEIAGSLQSYYRDNSVTWKNSPFQWIKGGISSSQKGKVGKEIVWKFLEEYGFLLDKPPNHDSDFVVAGKRVEVKLSTLWEGGHYTFQQIRNQDYDILFCLGLSPTSAHAYVAKKSEIVWHKLAHQHSGARGRDTWWISFKPPDCPHGWMQPHNGDLSQICDRLRKAIRA